MGRKKQGTVRIIAGHWRGRRLPVPDLPGLRPSGDRSRETLFNWLAPLIRGRRCADLFAGTGVLGLEAVSRGADSAVLVEKSAAAARSIRDNLDLLKAGQEGRRVEVVHGDALAWLDRCEKQSLDLVFIDPPFDSGLETRVLTVLVERECLAEDAIVYLETARGPHGSAPGQQWETMKEKVVGDVQMRLLRKKQNNL